MQKRRPNGMLLWPGRFVRDDKLVGIPTGDTTRVRQLARTSKVSAFRFAHQPVFRERWKLECSSAAKEPPKASLSQREVWRDWCCGVLVW